jgi:hypothetical protein
MVDDEMMLGNTSGADEEEGVQVISGANIIPSEELKHEMQSEDDGGRPLNLITYDQQRGKQYKINFC